MASCHQLVCSGCGGNFASRNALFRHLKGSGCTGGEVTKVEHCLLLFAYVGTPYHGSQHNSRELDEARHPTVEGQLRAALEAAAIATACASHAAVSVHSRSSRTDRGVHALANAIRLRVQMTFSSGHAAASSRDFWEPLLRGDQPHLLPAGVVLVRRFPLLTASANKEPPLQAGNSADVHTKNYEYLNVKHACKKREYVRSAILGCSRVSLLTACFFVSQVPLLRAIQAPLHAG